MKNLSILILCSLILSGYVIAQNAENNDPAAQKILDQLSKETKSYKSIKATFTYTLENKKENSKVARDGSLLLKGDKYKLEIAGQEIICNGNTLWTFIKDAEEVQVNEPEYEEGSINPANIFTVYENGFKYHNLLMNKPRGGNYIWIDNLDVTGVKYSNTNNWQQIYNSITY